MFSGFFCNQGDFPAKETGPILGQTKSKYEDVEFSCDQCEYKATRKDDLVPHIVINVITRQQRKEIY